ncbi:MAG: hypothetical protein M9962_09825 [Oligoflexia bacterium]|nr:hypothetical protein [Oligoflexia bacterium]
MKKQNLLFFSIFALLLSTAAYADEVFRCKSIEFSEQMSAIIRADSNGRAGRFEMDYWNGFPPVGILYAEYRMSRMSRNGIVLITEVDSLNKTRKANLTVPKNYQTLDTFTLEVELIERGRKSNYKLKCDHF